MPCDLASVEVDLSLELDAVAAHVRRLHVVQRSATSVLRGLISVLIVLVPGYNEQLHKVSNSLEVVGVIKWPPMGDGFTIEGRNSETRYLTWDRSMRTNNSIPSQIFCKDILNGQSEVLGIIS